MRYFLMFFAVLLLVIASGITAKGNDVGDTTAVTPAEAPTVSAGTPRVYPIAPGVWYPGDPLPEKPIRYYRVRCFPGCHRGSSYGKYPHEPLNMRPLFPTSTIDRGPAAPNDIQ
jgi:hypothetical protein